MQHVSKVVVVGATGYIGKLLFKEASLLSVTYGTGTLAINGMLSLRLDCPGQFDYGLIKPCDTVLLTAAISAPDICAREHERAIAINVNGTSEFIERVLTRGGRVVFFSSDTVYGERLRVFDESASINPAGEYAEMKAVVERRFMGNPLFKSIRLSYVFSREDKFRKYLSSCAERGETAELFHPFFRAIVHRGDVVAGALELVKRWDEFPQRVINFGGPEVLSRVDIAESLQRFMYPSLRFRVVEPAAEFFKNRPKVIAMSSELLPMLLGRPLLTLAEAVKDEFPQS